MGTGMSALAAASVISVASWVMIFSGALCGQLADRFGRADLILTVCLVGGMVSFALLPQAEWAIATSLAYGLIGVAPAGLIVALTGEAMAPHNGMGVYQSLFSIPTAAAPGRWARFALRKNTRPAPLAGRLCSRPRGGWRTDSRTTRPRPHSGRPASRNPQYRASVTPGIVNGLCMSNSWCRRTSPIV